MIPEILQLITQVAIVVFIVGSMAAMGLRLTIPKIVEPLRDVRLMAALLVANFVVVPAAAIAAGRLLPMEPAAASAVILIGCAAGAPFLPKLAQLACGNVALAVGAMVLLMVVTVFYAPIVVPLAVPGATVDAGQIARSLIVLMLVPLGIGLVVRARYPGLADDWVGPAGQASSAGLLIGISAAILLTWQDILGAIGTWIFIGTALVLGTGLLAGWLAGGAGPRIACYWASRRPSGTSPPRSWWRAQSAATPSSTRSSAHSSSRSSSSSSPARWGGAMRPRLYPRLPRRDRALRPRLNPITTSAVRCPARPGPAAPGAGSGCGARRPPTRASRRGRARPARTMSRSAGLPTPP